MPLPETRPAIGIRAERDGDRAGIFAVHAAAFPTEAEARLVDAIRAGGGAHVSLVAEAAGAIAGHVLFSPVAAESAPARVVGVGLAPLAVLPDCQRTGIGTRLVEAGLDACRREGFAFVVVLGEPGYYGRFGFRRALGAGLLNEYGADEAFMVRALYPGALSGVAGLVRYAPEFASASAG